MSLSPIPPEQALLRQLLRTGLRLFFRGLVRPPVPLALQRWLVRLLTCWAPKPLGVRSYAGPLGHGSAQWHVSGEAGAILVLYLHGGGFVLGSGQTHRAITGYLAQMGRMTVCALDYSLAPERPFPAALNDAMAAYRDLLARGHHPNNIVLAGDSAGANLALATCVQARNMGLPQPRALVCFSPFVDLSLSQLHEPLAGDPLIHIGWLQQVRVLYASKTLNYANPDVSPLFADLQGLAPMLLQVGTDERLLNDSVRLAANARSAGGVVELEIYPGMWHVFQVHVGLLTVSSVALSRVTQFIDARCC